MALINSNFTYGIFENKRDGWIDDITSCLNQFDIKFNISQHPRDKGDLSRYSDHLIQSNSQSINNQIMDSDLVITRFSSLIHEAILMGRKVIYYNCHNEEMKYDFRFNNKFLFICNSKQELFEVLKQLKFDPIEITKQEYNDYVCNHCVPTKINVLDNINFLVNSKINDRIKVKWNNYYKIIIFHPFVVKYYRRIKNLF